MALPFFNWRNAPITAALLGALATFAGSLALLCSHGFTDMRTSALDTVFGLVPLGVTLVGWGLTVFMCLLCSETVERAWTFRRLDTGACVWAPRSGCSAGAFRSWARLGGCSTCSDFSNRWPRPRSAGSRPGPDHWELRVGN